MGNKIALGSNTKGKAVITEPATIEERLSVMQQQIERLTAMVNDGQQKQKHNQVFNINRDKLPIGTTLVGNSIRGGIKVLTIRSNGYYIDNLKYDSLSAAAEAVSGVRRSGWTFWKLPDGRSVKEAFGRG